MYSESEKIASSLARANLNFRYHPNLGDSFFDIETLVL